MAEIARRKGGRSGIGAPGSGGRSALTPEIHRRICDFVRAGSHLNVAAQAAGIDDTTLSRWRTRGKQDEENGIESPYADLRRDLARAEAEAELTGIMRIRRAADEDWRADAWFMERRFPERWVLRQQVTVEEARIDGPVTTEFVMSPEAPRIVGALLDAFEAEIRPKLGPARLEEDEP
jgi:hypothetical protein